MERLMPTDPFLDDGSRIVTLEAFDFIFRNELKRAVRAQNFLTLLMIETTPVPKHERATVDSPAGGLVGGDVRETDLVAEGDAGRVWVLLLDTDLRNSMSVVDRLLSRFRHYGFSHANRHRDRGRLLSDARNGRRVAAAGGGSAGGAQRIGDPLRLRGAGPVCRLSRVFKPRVSSVILGPALPLMVRNKDEPGSAVRLACGEYPRA